MDYLLQCRRKGIIQGIVLSTWSGEVEKIANLGQQLVANNVATVTSNFEEINREKTFSGSDNYWRQAKQLQAALDLIPEDAIILKTRTDRAMPTTRRLIQMMDEPEPLPYVTKVQEERNLTNLPREFEHQIIIFKARTGRLLQFTDFSFMGYQQDVAKLINFDVSSLYFKRGMVANIQFFIYPFIRDYPVLRDYYRAINFQFLLGDLEAYTRQGGTQFPQFFQRLYAAYFGLLASHFRIGSLPSQKRLGELTGPIEFSDLFHSGQGRHLVHDELGVTLNSQAVLDLFMTQPLPDDSAPKQRWWHKKTTAPVQPAVTETATKRILRLLRHPNEQLTGKMTATEYRELQTFAANRDFSPHPWLRQLTPELKDQPAAYVESVAYRLPGLTTEQEQALWRKCEQSGNASRVLLDFWFTHELAPQDSAPYLMSSARTDNRFSVLLVARLLRMRGLSAADQTEALRITNFFGSFHVRHHQMNAEIAGYILARYLYFIEQGQPVEKSTVVQAKYVFERFFPTGFDAFEQLVGQRPEELATLFDTEIDRLRVAKKGGARQRVVEMALEVTHDPKYWTQLEKRFNGKYPRYERAYRYSVAQGLLVPSPATLTD
ncbi:hypothetical protein FD25_GL000817 [Levilactobacillus acidifarinae DSM 19394]|uniref:Uncharacterized protein n=2 Tax=Levilactobacillus acidifarinae TaxID=267364 RepID=A0A0R1LHB0_9LACO|nr:hypothetical protein FD25_GL000817 [Levilactobacillus acidifarinae DSM 19394]